MTTNPLQGMVSYDVATITSAGLLAVVLSRAQATSEAAAVIMATLGGEVGCEGEGRGRPEGGDVQKEVEAV